MTIFLTGATGFVGGALARQLIGAGHGVRALVRSPAKAEDLAALGVELYAGDITDKESMRRPMAGADAVFHVAGWYKVGVRDRQEATRVNVDGTRVVLELMQELEVPRGVYTSTIAVNSDTRGKMVDETFRFSGRHISIYDETKAEAHDIALGFISRGLPLTIVQPGLIYGPGDTSSVRMTLIQFLRRTLPLIPKRTSYSWAHVEDIAVGHILALEKGMVGRSYFLTGDTYTLEEALGMAEEITGVKAPRIRMPPGILRATARTIAPIVDRLVRLPPTYTAEGLRVVSGVTYIGSAARAKRELGWTPRPLREGLTETLEHEVGLLRISSKTKYVTKF